MWETAYWCFDDAWGNVLEPLEPELPKSNPH
jgi:hypothetical protein